MRLSVLATLVLLPVAAHPAVPEIELAPGIACSNDATQCSLSLRARAGLRFPLFTPSLLLVGLGPGTPGPPSHSRQDGGLQAWAVAAEARVHTPGKNQLWAGLGAGWGRLEVAQQTGGDLATFRGEASPYVEVSAGYRHLFDDVSVGLDASLQLFHRVSFYSDVGTNLDGSDYRGTSPVFGVALSLGFNP
jgi:hypothetical protein